MATFGEDNFSSTFLHSEVVTMLAVEIDMMFLFIIASNMILTIPLLSNQTGLS